MLGASIFLICSEATVDFGHRCGEMSTKVNSINRTVRLCQTGAPVEANLGARQMGNGRCSGKEWQYCQKSGKSEMHYCKTEATVGQVYRTCERYGDHGIPG
jgi:hypothetical protein